MSKHVYLSTSFWALSEQDQKKVTAFADGASKHDLDTRTFYLNRTQCAAVIGEDVGLLNHFNVLSPVFGVLGKPQKETIEQALLLIYYRLSTQYELDRLECMSHKLAETALQIRLCTNLINQLRLTSIEPKISQPLLKAIASSGGYIEYLGLKLLVPVLLESVDTIASRHQSATDFISFINERRLYWVWAGSSVSILLSAFPDYLSDSTHATDALGGMGLVGGSLSWMLYFMRAGFGWYGLIRHTLFPTEEERALNLTLSERFWVQWEMRKYQILNDTIWGICNFACFFVLVGTGLLGNIGNGLTAGLLLMDAILTLMRLHEEESAYFSRKKLFEEEMRRLEEKMAWSKTMNNSKMVDYQLAYDALKWKAAQAKLEWQYKLFQTSLDLLYASLLLISFGILLASVLLMPHVALMVAVGATISCFTLNLMYNTGTMAVGVSKCKAIKNESETFLLNKLKTFKALFTECASLDDATLRQETQGKLKLSYLEMRSLISETSYQEKMIVHQRNHLMVSTIRDVLIPAVFITSLVFLPLGVGVPLLVLSLTFAFGLYAFSQSTMPKKEPHVAVFPEVEYAAFIAKVSSSPLETLVLDLKPKPDERDPGIQSNYVYN